MIDWLFSDTAFPWAIFALVVAWLGLALALYLATPPGWWRR